MCATQRRAAIVSFGTAVPEYELAQRDFAAWMADSFPDEPVIGRWFRSICANSGIETRYTCVPDFRQPPHESRFSPGQPATEVPTTAERMEIYAHHSVQLGAAAGNQALSRFAEASNVPVQEVADSITHLVVVSCTGFFAPGPDIAIARRLTLSDDVERTLIGFMGCAAAFNGMRTATQIVRGHPDARVLVVCVEICSIHLQPGTDRENLISASLFGDGASACLMLDSRSVQAEKLEVAGFYTGVKPDTTTEMIWEIGDYGFVLNLSPQIPDHLADAAPAAIKTLFDDARPDFWAIHPGGRAIVDRLADVFELRSEDVDASRHVLQHVGNLSSATIFFVLDELRRSSLSDNTPTDGIAMAFGPGLVIEMARLRHMPA